MKKVNVTFTIPEDTKELLHSVIGRKKLSAFVSMTLRKALDEKLNNLKKAYREAEKDPSRIDVINDWKLLDTEDWE